MNLTVDSENRPLVSVVIPFLNNHEEVLTIKKLLINQTYPSDKLEVLLIDNGSDSALELNEDKRFKLLKEESNTNSPYSARNRGIEMAKGELIAFIDANSSPDREWLETGVNCLQKHKSELVAGEVLFDFGTRITACKIVDSMTSIQVEKAVLNRGVAYTANLFVKREVFHKIGMFEEGIRSGGDVRFTQKATKSGLKLVYCEGAIVHKKARGFWELYRKKIRTGKGYFYTWKRDVDKPIWFYNLFRSFKPPKIPKLNEKHSKKVSRIMVWVHLYLTGIVEQLSFVFEYFKYTIGGQRDYYKGKR